MSSLQWSADTEPLDMQLGEPLDTESMLVSQWSPEYVDRTSVRYLTPDAAASDDERLDPEMK